ncbi:MAG TPA: ABC transporter ATP-binding protein [Methylomirabilota bacterium]|nr:ABC transporter ATP-binding protein [Methylomirabilota bacterium]
MSFAAPPVVEMNAVTKRYGTVEAVRGISLRIAPGEIVAMLGPNGAGKTTSVGLMLGLRTPTSGTVRLFGLPPTDRRARSRAGVMLQESGTTSVLTPREIVRLFGTYYPAPMPTERALALAGLTDKADARIGTLSGGQRQRLYLALAVCGDPDVLFLDEPTVGMDVEARRAFVTSIQTLAAAGKTVLFTTHYLREAEELARRIVVIDRGVVIADAAPRELMGRVAAKRVAFTVVGALPAGVFAGLPVAALASANGHVRFLTGEPESVLRALFARGVELRDLEVVGADLEEAFLSLTRREEPA